MAYDDVDSCPVSDLMQSAHRQEVSDLVNSAILGKKKKKIFFKGRDEKIKMCVLFPCFPSPLLPDPLHLSFPSVFCATIFFPLSLWK